MLNLGMEMRGFCKRGDGWRNAPTDGFRITDDAQMALGARHCHCMYSGLIFGGWREGRQEIGRDTV